MWKELEPALTEDGENRQTQDDHWGFHGVTMIPTSSKVGKWCASTPGLIAVNAIQDIIILKEQALCYFFGQKVLRIHVSKFTFRRKQMSLHRIDFVNLRSAWCKRNQTTSR
jgi:hypothetical protein